MCICRNVLTSKSMKRFTLYWGITRNHRMPALRNEYWLYVCMCVWVQGYQSKLCWLVCGANGKSTIHMQHSIRKKLYAEVRSMCECVCVRVPVWATHTLVQPKVPRRLDETIKKHFKSVTTQWQWGQRMPGRACKKKYKKVVEEEEEVEKGETMKAKRLCIWIPGKGVTSIAEEQTRKIRTKK